MKVTVKTRAEEYGSYGQLLAMEKCYRELGMMKKLSRSFFSIYRATSCKLKAQLVAPTREVASFMLFGTGVVLLGCGMNGFAIAQHATEYNDVRFADALNAIFIYVEGTFGAMVMVSAGIGAIMSSAFGQYRASLSLLVVAIGAFILRSLVGTFFNDDEIRR